MSLFVNNYFNVEDYHVSEKEKSGFDYLKKSVDYHISSLVREKTHIKKARNLYEGKRDKNEFRYLEETFGIETPIAVKMTPIIKTRIDVLLGLLLDEVFTYRVSVNDNATVTKVEDAKKNLRAERMLEAYSRQLAQNSSRVKNGEQPKKDVVTDGFVKRLERFITEDYISEFEIAAQSIIKFFSQDSTIDLEQKVKQFFLEVLLSGEGYYRTYVEQKGEDPVLQVFKSENIFFSKKTGVQFLNSGSKPNVNAIVHRDYMKRSEILTRFGHIMNEAALNEVFGNYSQSGSRRTVDPRTLDYLYRNDQFHDSGSVHNQHTNSNMDTLPVYHVEWLANNYVEVDEDDAELRRDMELVERITTPKEYKEVYGKDAGDGRVKKKKWRLDRYEGWRIGEDIYVSMGKSKNIPRSIGKPWLTTLSYNGLNYNDANGSPYSMTLSLKDIQDSYDIVKFFRDNLIANAGVDGSRVNLAGIPKILGQDYMERLMKFIALRKQGLEVYDPTEEGAHLFQHYGEFRGSLNPGTIEALATVLESLEREADIVTGVNRHMFQAAEVRDAVANVKVGQQTTSLVTKDIFQLVSTSRKHMLEDLINKAKITYAKGKRGSYIVGHRQVLFGIQPENFCFTDYNIHVVNNSRDNMKLEKIAAIMPELVGAGALKPDVLIKVTMSDSPTEILQIITDSMLESDTSNEQMGQLNQQVEQMNEQVKQYEAELKKAQSQIESLTKSGDQLKQADLNMRTEESQNRTRLADERLDLDTMIAQEEVTKDKMIVQLEREQLYAENTSGNAREIKNNI
jgi:hypothetical protein